VYNLLTPTLRLPTLSKLSAVFDEGSIFKDLATASAFFKNGSTGYSPNGKKHDGLSLYTDTWEVQPLSVTAVRSSFFENESVFPKGTVRFDNALLMTNIRHDWLSAPEMRR
jgi:hypothetical protein